jgi:DNA-binding response OmpR family regulator
MLKPLLADNSSVDLIFDDASVLPTLRTDEGKVSQILRNLISNSIKFTPQGKVSVSATMVDDKSVQFTVEDTGIGIAPENHETIFQEFGQVENSLQDRYRGTGLGLPLCRNLAKLLGGKIWLESEVGKGSAFFVKIPAVYVGELSKQDKSDLPPAPEFHRTPILILEDDEETAHLLESFLRDTEFQPILTSTVSEAESWSARHSPAAVIADIYLDDDQSWRFLSQIREKRPGLPTIVSSVHDESATAIAKGASIFLQKPVEREVLLKELRRLTSLTGTQRVLLVDDNEVARYILRDLLDLPWLDVREAANGTEALASISERKPDAVILDLLMPDISGFEVLRRLRGNPVTESLPVLIYTSKPLTEAEKDELNERQVKIIRKEDVTSRLSVQPFLDWLKSAGVASGIPAQEQNA